VCGLLIICIARSRRATNASGFIDEAPIAYVHEGLDSNSSGQIVPRCEVLESQQKKEVKALTEEILWPTRPTRSADARSVRVHRRGTDTSGVVLELRRKDNGKPLWIQWWSKPDIGGKFTRTMFVDITERVLMEQEKPPRSAEHLFQEEIRSEHNFGEIVGSSPALLDVLHRSIRSLG